MRSIAAGQNVPEQRRGNGAQRNDLGEWRPSRLPAAKRKDLLCAVWAFLTHAFYTFLFSF
jgi:hypothetical protein